MTLRAAILDIDGTLVDSNYEHVRAWHEAFRRHDLTVPQVHIHEAIGMGGDMLIPYLLGWEADDPRSKPIESLHSEIFKARVYGPHLCLAGCVRIPRSPPTGRLPRGAG